MNMLLIWSIEVEWKEHINQVDVNVATNTVSALGWNQRMVVKYWPVVVLREESASPSPVKRIHRDQVDKYLHSGNRTTMRGITLYTKPTDSLEVGFLIRKGAGSAVQRIKTRRLFWGVLNNTHTLFPNSGGYLFLFHNSFRSTTALLSLVEKLIARSSGSAE